MLFAWRTFRVNLDRRIVAVNIRPIFVVGLSTQAAEGFSGTGCILIPAYAGICVA
jgi:hypothetical protein